MIAVQRLASVAPERPPQQHSNRLEAIVHNTAVEWAAWCRTRRFYGAPRPVGSIMEALVRVPGRSGDGPNARNDPRLARFHLAIIHSPDVMGRGYFIAQYLGKVNVTQAAECCGLSRTHWYRLVNAFARSAYSAIAEVD